MYVRLEAGGWYRVEPEAGGVRFRGRSSMVYIPTLTKWKTEDMRVGYALGVLCGMFNDFVSDITDKWELGENYFMRDKED